MLHEDNQLGQALLLASVAISKEESKFAGDYFFNRILPAAMPYYEPLMVNEPAVGSGIMLLAAASTLPEWAVKLGLIRFTGQDIDQTCVRMASINCMLYGLNGYGACLTQSAAESVALGVHPKVEYTTYSNGPLFRRDKFEL